MIETGKEYELRPLGGTNVRVLSEGEKDNFK